jgi:hypothetical protein
VEDGQASAAARSAHVSPLDGATKADSSPWTGALRFDVYEENAGCHRWRLRTRGARDLATSCESFATRRDA